MCINFLHSRPEALRGASCTKTHFIHSLSSSHQANMQSNATPLQPRLCFFEWNRKSGEIWMLYIDLRPSQTCHFKDGGSCISRWPVMGRDCIGELGWQYGTGLKSHGTVTDWFTGRRWPVNCMTVISARWRSNMPFQGRQKFHIPLPSYGKRLSGRKTII